MQALETCAMDCAKASEWYESLPDGRTTAARTLRGSEGQKAAKAAQIDAQISAKLGRRADIQGRTRNWLGSSTTLGDLKKAAAGKTLNKPIAALEAVYEIWGVDLTPDNRFSRVSVRKEAADLIEIGEVTVERTQPDASRPYQLRVNKVELKKKAKRWGSGHFQKDYLVELGLTDAVLKIELSSQDDQKTFSEMVHSHPGCSFEPLVIDLVPYQGSQSLGQSRQSGIAIGLSVQWAGPESRWQFLKPSGVENPRHNGRMVNAILCEFVAKPGETVQINLTVEQDNFDADVYLTKEDKQEILDKSDDPNRYVNDVRTRLANQILKQRLAGSDRFTLAGGKVPIE